MSGVVREGCNLVAPCVAAARRAIAVPRAIFSMLPVVAIVAMIVTIGMVAADASAQASRPAGERGAAASSTGNSSSAAPAATPIEQITALQSRMWRAFYEGKLDEAAGLSDELVRAIAALQKRADVDQSALERARLEVGHCLARVHWAQGGSAGSAGLLSGGGASSGASGAGTASSNTAASSRAAAAATARGQAARREQAKKLWAAIGRSERFNAGIQRQSIALALQAQADGQPAEAASLLEAVVKRNLPDTCTAEAAIDLSRLYSAGRRFADADRMLAAVLAAMEKHQKGGEVTAAAAGPFVATLKAARRQLKYDEAAGRLEFERAEKLRKDEKYVDAVAAYRDIVARLPDCDYAARSELHIGTCMKAAGETERAVNHWQSFVDAAPSGPYRGQALTEIASYYIAEQFDLEAATRTTALAVGQLAAGLRSKDKPTAESWRAASYDIHLLAGIVDYVQGNAAAAAKAFEAALEASSGAAAAQGLPELIAAAKAGRPLLPQEVGGVDAAGDGRVDASVNQRVALMLALGRIYNLGGRFAAAEEIFARVLPVVGRPADKAAGIEAIQGRPPMPGANAAQVAYAAFGLGVSIEGQGDRAGEKTPAAPTAGNSPSSGSTSAGSQSAGAPSAARAAYELSLKTFARGSWHDETLFRLATLIQRQADKAHAKPAEDAGATGSGKDGATDRAARRKPLSKDDLDRQAAAEKARLTALAKARAEALPVWQELVKRYGGKTTDGATRSDAGTGMSGFSTQNSFAGDAGGATAATSPYVEVALYSIGILTCDLAEAGLDAASRPVADDKSEAMWREAFACLVCFTENYASSPLAGDAYLRQISVQLLELFDIKKSILCAEKALAWTQIVKTEVGSTSNTKSELQVAYSPNKVSKKLLYTIHLKASLVFFLEGEIEKTANILKASCQYDNSPRKISGFETSTDRLLKVIGGAMPLLTPDDVSEKIMDGRQKTQLIIADLYLLLFCPSEAEGLYRRLLGRDASFWSSSPELESYIIFRLGQAVKNKGLHDESLAILNQLYNQKFVRSPWAAEGIFRLGTWAYNATDDESASMPHWQYVFTNFPHHPEAERALFYYGIIARKKKMYEEAHKSFLEYLKRYPDSRWSQRVRTELLPSVQVLENKEKKHG